MPVLVRHWHSNVVPIYAPKQQSVFLCVRGQVYQPQKHQACQLHYEDWCFPKLVLSRSYTFLTSS